MEARARDRETRSADLRVVGYLNVDLAISGGLAGVHREVQHRRTQHLDIGERADIPRPRDRNRRAAATGRDRAFNATSATSAPTSTDVSRGGLGRAYCSRSSTFALRPSIRAIIAPDDLAVAGCGDAALEHLQGRSQSRKGVSHLMRHNRRHLPEVRQRRLRSQLRLGVLARRDVAANCQVLSRLSTIVQEGHDGRVHPVQRSVLRPILNLSPPDLALGDGPPEIPNELLG